MGNPQPRVFERRSRFNDYSKYPKHILCMEKWARMGSKDIIYP